MNLYVIFLGIELLFTLHFYALYMYEFNSINDLLRLIDLTFGRKKSLKPLSG